jgi:charged multivesicular body protein 4
LLSAIFWSPLSPYPSIRLSSDDIQSELANELEELQQEELNNRLSEADHVPVHLPPGSVRAPVAQTRTPVAVEDDEEAQLEELKAALAM